MIIIICSGWDDDGCMSGIGIEWNLVESSGTLRYIELAPACAVVVAAVFLAGKFGFSSPSLSRIGPFSKRR
jgi:hypothetical protein